MAIWTLLSILVVPASQTIASTGPLPEQTMVAEAPAYLPLSQQWATSYEQSPLLVAMPVALEEEETAGDADEIVVETVAGEQELIALARPHQNQIDELALDWGTAQIGPGVLYPQEFASGQQAGRPTGGSPNGGVSAAAVMPPLPPVPPGPPPGVPPGPPPGVPPGPPPPVTPVPEPSACMIWGMLLGVAVLTVLRR